MGDLVGLLLAAGSGRRFDPSGQRLKLLERAPIGPHAGQPLAVAAARNLRAALSEVVAVVRAVDSDAQRTLHALLAAEGCRLVVCAGADQGMGASLACGVQASADAAGWVVALADMPAIEPGSVRAVAQALRDGYATVAPFLGARRGHPVGFARALYAELAALDGDEGARSVLAAHPPYPVAVADRGVVLDLDTPESFARR